MCKDEENSARSREVSWEGEGSVACTGVRASINWLRTESRIGFSLNRSGGMPSVYFIE